MRSDRARVVAVRIVSSPGAVLAVLFLVGLIVIACAAGLIAPEGPLEQDLAATLELPSAALSTACRSASWPASSAAGATSS